jgi:type I restriction enzyme, R subunit
MPAISNFGFLERHGARLATLGALAERYFRGDPPTEIVKLRQFAEFLAKLIAAHHALYIGERETFEETLRRLSYERIVPKEAADLFHVLRKLGNAAVHDAKGSHAEALASLKFARQLGVWFHRTYGRQPNFSPGAFVPPPEPFDAAASLREEIEGDCHIAVRRAQSIGGSGIVRRLRARSAMCPSPRREARGAFGLR